MLGISVRFYEEMWDRERNKITTKSHQTSKHSDRASRHETAISKALAIT